MVEHVLDPARSRARHLVAEELFPLGGRAREERGAQFRHDFHRVLCALAHGVVTRVCRKLGEAGQLA
jgi:hypothetical protein